VTSSSFIKSLASLRFDNAFNPYADACPEHDAPDAPLIRRNNIALVLDAALARGTESLWIARDLGYRGGRRTGLPLTDEVHLSSHANLYGSLALTRATRGPIVGERTAHVIWDVLKTIDQPVCLWNVFPLHPHVAGDPLSNRCHNRKERAASLPLLKWLLDALSPRVVFAIGRDAQQALEEMRISATPVRHPSYGGQHEFTEAMYRHYGVTGRGGRPLPLESE
jgi:hypothetical protein